MQYRRLGQGPLTVSEISFGTWLTVAGGVERTGAIACVHAALDHGINLFDTANQYGAGEAERVLGEGLRSSSKSRDKYLIATKVFNPVGDELDKGLSAAQIAKQLDRSLARLGTDISTSTSAIATTKRLRWTRRSKLWIALCSRGRFGRLD
jgi:1-deoxyxylulose-5-phosphate synthase